MLYKTKFGFYVVEKCPDNIVEEVGNHFDFIEKDFLPKTLQLFYLDELTSDDIHFNVEVYEDNEYHEKCDKEKKTGAQYWFKDNRHVILLRRDMNYSVDENNMDLYGGGFHETIHALVQEYVLRKGCKQRCKQHENTAIVIQMKALEKIGTEGAKKKLEECKGLVKLLVDNGVKNMSIDSLIAFCVREDSWESFSEEKENNPNWFYEFDRDHAFWSSRHLSGKWEHIF